MKIKYRITTNVSIRKRDMEKIKLQFHKDYQLSLLNLLWSIYLKNN